MKAIEILNQEAKHLRDSRHPNVPSYAKPSVKYSDATINGRSVKIEVKKGRDYQSQAQQEYQESIIKAGGIYFIAKDFEMFLNWYDKTFLNHG
jgi:hypothetical protein